MNKPRPRAVLWALLSLIPAFATGAGSDDASSSTPDPLDLLERMSRSVHYLNYEGNFVFFHDGVLDGMRIAHTEHDGYEREHVVTLTGVPHQVVRDNFTMTRFLPEKKAVTVKERRYRRGGPLLMSFDPAVLGEVYAFRFLGKGRIAGRVADVVGIQPNDQLRYGYRLYLDEEFGLPLKTDILDAKGKAISQLMFTDISVTPEAAASIQASEAKVDALRPPAPKTYSGDWQFTDLPPGFTMAAHRRWEGNSSQAGEHLLFTDGMASVSVYVEEGAAADHKEGASRMGAVMALGVPRDGHLITVVGEVPLSTLRLVLKSMSRKSDE